MYQYIAFYDASGSETDGDGVIYVAGMLSTADKWFRLDREWADVLRRFRVPYFHMKEFAPGVGPFASWRDDKDKRREFLERLFRVVKKGVNKSFGHGFSLADFRSVNRLYRFSEQYGGAYSFAAGACSASVRQWMAKNKPRTAIYHVFEKGDAGQHHLARLLPKYEGIIPLIIPKTETYNGAVIGFAAFQAADLIAWEMRRGLDDFLKGAGIQPRKSLTALLRTIPTQCRFQDAGGITKFAEMRNIPRRSS
jgi:hypothetical protein